jgi:hypothetical protein
MSNDTDTAGHIPAHDLLTFEGRARHGVPEVIHISKLPPDGSPVALAIEKALGGKVEYTITSSGIFSPWASLSQPYREGLEAYRDAVRIAAEKLRTGSEDDRLKATMAEARASNNLVDRTRASVEATTLMMNHLKSIGAKRHIPHQNEPGAEF